MGKGKNNIDIILPNRIGDSILALPAIVCLKQLFAAYEKDIPNIKILTSNDLTAVINALNLARVERLNSMAKFKSYLCPANKAIFLYTSSKNMFYHAKKTYGIIQRNKKYANYSVDMPYLSLPLMKETFPETLMSFLSEEHHLSTVAISFFGMCLELGYTVEQIFTAFKFSPEDLNFNVEFFGKPIIQDDYIVFCTEAAYGKKRDEDRRWGEENFLQLAEKVYNFSGLKSVFIGIDNKPLMFDKPYFVDMRAKLTLAQTAQILKHSKGYIGNDTGPLHIANLVQKPSFCIYFREASTIDYTPIFPKLNTIILNPQGIEEVIPVLEGFLKAVL